MDGSCSDHSGSRRSGPAEDRAQPAEGRSRRTGGGSGPTTSIRRAGGALTDRMTAETLKCTSGLGMWNLHMHAGRHGYDYSEVVLTLFRSIEFSNMSLRFKRRIKRVSNIRCCIQALNLNHVCCCFTSASGLDSSFIRHTRPKDDIYPSHSLA